MNFMFAFLSILNLLKIYYVSVVLGTRNTEINKSAMVFSSQTQNILLPGYRQYTKIPPKKAHSELLKELNLDIKIE